jgi:hypothetical protein
MVAALPASRRTSPSAAPGPFNVCVLAPPLTGDFTVATPLTLPSAVITVSGPTAAFTPPGQLIIEATSGSQLINYTGVSGNTFTGCTGGTGAIVNGQKVFVAKSGTSFDGSIITQEAFRTSALSVPGGANAPTVLDYNCNTSYADSQAQLNCVALNQNAVSNTFLRQERQRCTGVVSRDYTRRSKGRQQGLSPLQGCSRPNHRNSRKIKSTSIRRRMIFPFFLF